MERHDKRLTEHFCLDEFTYSGIAVDNAINNQPPPCACLALQNFGSWFIGTITSIVWGTDCYIEWISE